IERDRLEPAATGAEREPRLRPDPRLRPHPGLAYLGADVIVDRGTHLGRPDPRAQPLVRRASGVATDGDRGGPPRIRTVGATAPALGRAEADHAERAEQHRDDDRIHGTNLPRIPMPGVDSGPT